MEDELWRTKAKRTFTIEAKISFVPDITNMWESHKKDFDLWISVCSEIQCDDFSASTIYTSMLNL
jgi:hypothetical protein